MPELLAIIDCGTNTFNLLIVELKKDGSFCKKFNTRIPVKLGEGAINQGYILSLAFNRGLAAIESFAAEISHYGVSNTLAYATSAIRDAQNGLEFTALVKEKYNIEIEVIDGDREAALIAHGVMAAVKTLPGRSLIMDIGGGSTEFIIAEEENILWKQSFNIGAARLLDRFKPSDPITSSEIQSVNDFLKLKLEPLLTEFASLPCGELLGSSGAFDSLVEMIHGEMGGEALSEDKTEYNVDLNRYREISKKVMVSNLEERRRIRGLVAMRLDMIVISCLMVDFILNSFDLKRMRVSTFSLKEGAVVEYIRNKSFNFEKV